MPDSLDFLPEKDYNEEKKAGPVMKNLSNYLETSYTAFQAVENAKKLLEEHGFEELFENASFSLKAGGKYFVIRGGSAIIAFTVGAGSKCKIVASHTDSPCLKLKENPVMSASKFQKLNVEPYGGGIWYSFFDRPLKLAGRLIKEEAGKLVAQNFVSDFCVTIPSLAVHMQRDVNDKFAPNPQVDLLPLLGMDEIEFSKRLGEPIAYDLFAASAEKPFESGANGEFLSSPRIDNLSSVYSSLVALATEEVQSGICMAACLDSEEVGSRTLQGAGSDFLRSTLLKIFSARGLSECEMLSMLRSSLLISLDNAHSLHPNHPEKCDPTNTPTLGGGIVIKGHAGGAYTTDALTSAIVKKIFDRANVRYQCFFNRSDMRSGSTLGAISLSEIGIPSVDLGLAPLAMHSAVETMAKSDFEELLKGLNAFYRSEIEISGNCVEIK